MWEKKLSQKIAKQCIRLGATESEAVLAFGIELMIISSVGIGIIIIISALLMRPLLWLPFLLGFVPVRKFAGGFHASTHLNCYIISALLFLCCILVSMHINLSNLILAIVSTVTWLVVFFLSPVAANNKPLKEMQRKKNRRISLIVVSLDVAIAVVLFVTKWIGESAKIYFLGAFSASLSLVIAKVTTFMRKEDSL